VTRTWSRALGLGVAVVLAIVSAPLSARMQDPTDGELRRLAESYAQAWAKGDARALTALYTSDAIRVGPEGQIAIGRAKIEQNLSGMLNGPFRGSKIVLTYGVTGRAAQDAYVAEGTYNIAGGIPPAGIPTRGRFMQTIVRSSGRWQIAGDGVLTAPRPAK
jgi:uncharacterized protein (TIGR02246 family)